MSGALDVSLPGSWPQRTSGVLRPVVEAYLRDAAALAEARAVGANPI